MAAVAVILDGGHLGFPIGTMLVIFDLQVTLTLPTKFQVSCHFGSGEEAQNKLSRWPPWRPYLGFSIGTILAIVHIRRSDTSYQVLS